MFCDTEPMLSFVLRSLSFATSFDWNPLREFDSVSIKFRHVICVLFQSDYSIHFSLLSSLSLFDNLL